MVAGAWALALVGSQPAQAQMDSGVGQAHHGGEAEPGQAQGMEGMEVEAAIAATQVTSRSHTVAAGASAANLEGTACAANFKMIGGSCHPGYNDRVVIINQFPNIPGNTWRCGFKNNTTGSLNVWIYTVCGQ
jgi:hypothetical protein